jgi:hypothetical protein
MAAFLEKLVDANQWEAEDIVGRLGIVFHAAFVFAGFHPCGAQPPSGHLLKRSIKAGDSLCLSRWYTAPELARRTGADAAVLMLYVQGREVAILIFLTTEHDTESAYLERLDLETARPLLCRSLGGVEPWVSRICKSLADGVCWGLLDEIRRNNSLPSTSFVSLPDDLKVLILKKLTDGKDLARVECVSDELRLLVAAGDGELWKPLFEALPKRRARCFRDLLLFSFRKSSGENVCSWKKKYMDARPRSFSWIWDPLDEISDFSAHPEDWLQNPPEQEEKVPTRDERAAGGHRRKKAAWSDCKKQKHCSGAIHSPSSRYRWKHR